MTDLRCCETVHDVAFGFIFNKQFAFLRHACDVIFPKYVMHDAPLLLMMLSLLHFSLFCLLLQYFFLSLALLSLRTYLRIIAIRILWKFFQLLGGTIVVSTEWRLPCKTSNSFYLTFYVAVWRLSVPVHLKLRIVGLHLLQDWEKLMACLYQTRYMQQAWLYVL